MSYFLIGIKSSGILEKVEEKSVAKTKNNIEVTLKDIKRNNSISSYKEVKLHNIASHKRQKYSFD